MEGNFALPQRFMVPPRAQPPQPQQSFNSISNTYPWNVDSTNTPPSEPYEQKHAVSFQFSPISAPTSSPLASAVAISQSPSAMCSKQQFSVQSITHSQPESPSTAPSSPVSSPSSDSSASVSALPPMQLPFHTSHLSSEYSVGPQGDVTQIMLTWCALKLFCLFLAFRVTCRRERLVLSERGEFPCPLHLLTTNGPFSSFSELPSRLFTEVGYATAFFARVAFFVVLRF